MKGFFEKYKLEINVFLCLLFLSLAIFLFVQYSTDQKFRTLIRAIVFCIFTVTSGIRVNDCIKSRREENNNNL
jgi:ABC-type transport system involved in Fe-S cluster assembly fused permease/ATPase subunit